jgi:hypothetical protein
LRDDLKMGRDFWCGDDIAEAVIPRIFKTRGVIFGAGMTPIPMEGSAPSRSVRSVASGNREGNDLPGTDGAVPSRRPSF